MRDIMDRAAIGLSFVCLVHCLIMPFLIVLLPMAVAGASAEHGETTHVIMFMLAVPLSLGAMIFGFKAHGRRRYGVLALLGLAALVCGLTLHGTSAEVFATVMGCLILAFSHIGNRNASRLSARSPALEFEAAA